MLKSDFPTTLSSPLHPTCFVSDIQHLGFETCIGNQTRYMGIHSGVRSSDQSHHSSPVFFLSSYSVYMFWKPVWKTEYALLPKQGIKWTVLLSKIIKWAEQENTWNILQFFPHRMSLDDANSTHPFLFWGRRTSCSQQGGCYIVIKFPFPTGSFHSFFFSRMVIP